MEIRFKAVVECTIHNVPEHWSDVPKEIAMDYLTDVFLNDTDVDLDEYTIKEAYRLEED